MQALNDFFKLHNDTENKYSNDLFPSGVPHPDFIDEHRTSLPDRVIVSQVNSIILRDLTQECRKIFDLH